MLLALDIGNTQTCLGLFADDDNLITWRISTERSYTSNELALVMTGLLQLKGVGDISIDEAVICSVVPQLTRDWSRALEDLFGCSVLHVDSTLNLPFQLAHPNPEEIGADRLANMAAAQAMYGSPVIVVDFGTATNIDVMDAKDTYRGGTLAPGIQISNEALFARAARLAQVSLEKPVQVIGATTDAALQSGILYGAAASVEGLVSRIRDELQEPDAPVIATGGLASLIADCTTVFSAVDCNLTLKGLKILSSWMSKGEDDE